MSNSAPGVVELPPAEFRRQALWSDPKVYEEAAADPEAWWLLKDS